MPAVASQFSVSPDLLMRMAIEYIEGNDYQVMRRIQELPCNTDSDVAAVILHWVHVIGGELLSFMPEISFGQHIRDIYLITAYPQSAYIGFAVCDDE